MLDMYSTCHGHGLDMFGTRIVHVPAKIHTCFEHVSGHILDIYWTCFGHVRDTVLDMHWVCLGHVLYMFCTYLVHAFDLFWTWLGHVSEMFYHISHRFPICFAHVSDMCWTCSGHDLDEIGAKYRYRRNYLPNHLASTVPAWPLSIINKVLFLCGTANRKDRRLWTGMSSIGFCWLHKRWRRLVWLRRATTLPGPTGHLRQAC